VLINTLDNIMYEHVYNILMFKIIFKVIIKLNNVERLLQWKIEM